MARVVVVLGVACLGFGCAGPPEFEDADLSQPDVVQRMEYQVRPTTMQFLEITYPEACDEQPPTACALDGDADGQPDEFFSGRATVTERDGGVEIAYRNFEHRVEEGCDSITIRIDRGTFTEWNDGRFEVDAWGEVAVETCKTDGPASELGERYQYRVDYAGQAVRDSSGFTVWSGAGRYADSLVGAVETSTEDFRQADILVRDADDCGLEPKAGSARMLAAGREIQLTYDGLGACDGLGTWSLDGASQGELAVRGACTTGAGAPAGALFTLVGILAMRRRRASAQATRTL